MKSIRRHTSNYSTPKFDVSIAAGTAYEDDARSLEILVALSSRPLFDGSKNGTGTLAAIGICCINSTATGASPVLAATHSVFRQCFQLRNVAL